MSRSDAISRRGFLLGAMTVPVLSARPISSRADHDGALVVDGRRRFLLGLYHLPQRPNAWRLAADAGFDVVHTPAGRQALDTARAYGMHGWVTTGSISPASRTADRRRIAALVAALKDHPALLFWETEDEPSYQWRKAGPRVPPEVIRETYAFIKQRDPAHAVYLNHAPTNLVSTLRRYNPGCDMLGTDIYPVVPQGIRPLYGLWEDGRHGDLLNTHISQVGQYMDKLRQVAGRSRAAVMVLQAFAWENLRGKDRDHAMILYPTRDQLRFMAFQSIVHGANGLIWWGLHSTPATSRLWDDLAHVARELRDIDEALAAPAAALPLQVEYHDVGHSLDRRLEWIAKPLERSHLVIAVNADPNPVEVSIRGLGAEPVRARLPPFGVRLFRRSAR